MKMFWLVPAIAMISMVAGCSESKVAVQQGSGAAGSGTVNSQYVLTSEPDGAIPVGEARESVKDGQEVTLVGVIGGSAAPFVDGLAAFSIVDPKVEYCAPEEGCSTPWDYCCTQDEVKDNLATVKLVDETGKPVSQNAQEVLGVKELSTVVVQGTAKRDEAGNLTVAATKVFVRPGN